MKLIYFTMPILNSNNEEFFNLSRTLLLAMGAGFFGLLGFIVGGFAISSSKNINLIKEMYPSHRLNYELHEDLTYIFIDHYKNYLQQYRSTVRLIIFNIIATFLTFIITCIPMPINNYLFWICSILIVFSFYFAIFYTLKLFTLGLASIELEIEQVSLEIVEHYRKILDMEYQEFKNR